MNKCAPFLAVLLSPPCTQSFHKKAKKKKQQWERSQWFSVWSVHCLIKDFAVFIYYTRMLWIWQRKRTFVQGPRSDQRLQREGGMCSGLWGYTGLGHRLLQSGASRASLNYVSLTTLIQTALRSHLHFTSSADACTSTYWRWHRPAPALPTQDMQHPHRAQHTAPGNMSLSRVWSNRQAEAVGRAALSGRSSGKAWLCQVIHTGFCKKEDFFFFLKKFF